MPLTDLSQVSTVTVQQVLGSVQTVGSETPTVDKLDASANILECHGTVIPTITTPGYSKNGTFRKTDAAGGTSGLYTNIGTTLSCNFQVVETAVGAPLPLSTGKIYEGVANVATEKTLGATFAGASDTTSSVTGGTPAGTNSAPTLTMGGAAITATLSGFTGTTSGTTTTITAGGATVAAHALAGGIATDGTTQTTILDNSALTATTGTITTVIGLAGTITATGAAYQHTGTVSAPTFSGTALSGHTHTVTPTGTVTPTYS